MIEKTQTGVPIIDCDTCARRHPEPRRHCIQCGSPSAFLDSDIRCIRHAKRTEPGVFDPRMPPISDGLF